MKRLRIAVVGAVMVAAGTIAFSSAYVAAWSNVTIFGGLCLFAGLMFKRTFGTFMRQIHALDEPEENLA